jgi:hypothetical protein
MLDMAPRYSRLAAHDKHRAHLLAIRLQSYVEMRGQTGIEAAWGLDQARAQRHQSPSHDQRRTR